MACLEVTDMNAVSFAFGLQIIKAVLVAMQWGSHATVEKYLSLCKEAVRW